MSNIKRVFGGLEKKKIDLLSKILTQLDSDNESIQIAAMLAAGKLLKKEGFRWSEIARAVEISTSTAQSPTIQDSASSRDPFNNEDSLYKRPVAPHPKKDYFTPGRVKAFIINAVYNQGYMSIVLRLEDRIIKASITNRAEAHFFYNKKGTTVEANISRIGKKWIVGSPA